MPKFGIEREVRVCDPCFDQYGPKEQDSPRPHQPSKKKLESDLPEEYLASALSQQVLVTSFFRKLTDDADDLLVISRQGALKKVTFSALVARGLYSHVS